MEDKTSGYTDTEERELFLHIREACEERTRGEGTLDVDMRLKELLRPYLRTTEPVSSLVTLRDELDVIASASLEGQGVAGRLQAIIAKIDEANMSVDDCRHIFGNMADWPRKCMTCGKDEATISEDTLEIACKTYEAAKTKKQPVELIDKGGES